MSNGLAGVTLFTISPDQKHLYAPGEFDDALALFSRESLTGLLSFQGALFNSLPAIEGLNGAEGVVVSPDGKNIYVGSNAGHQLAVFGREPDTTPPDTEITSGPPAQTSNSRPGFAFASAEQFLAGFECRLDGAAFGACTGAGEHTASPLADGAHAFEVRALDTAGNPDPSPAAHPFVVDTTAPDTAITCGPSGRTEDTTPSFSFTGSDLNLAGFECQLNGGPFEPCSGSGEHTVATALGDGVHSFSVRARDAAGNIDSSPATRSFSLDATAPDTQITRRPKNRLFTDNNKVRVRYIWIADEPGSSFMCSLDGAPLAPCGTKKAKFKVKAQAGKGRKHIFRVQAVDAVGNADPTPATDRFRAILGSPPLGRLSLRPQGGRREVDRAAGDDPQHAGHVLADPVARGSSTSTSTVPASREITCDGPERGEHVVHLLVAREQQRREPLDPLLAGALGEQLGEGRAEAAALPLVDHGDRRLGARRRRRGGRSGRRRRRRPSPGRSRSAPRGRGGRPRSGSAAASPRAR